MIRIDDKKKLSMYIKKHAIDEIFSADMSGFMQLVMFKRGEYICRDQDKLDYLYFFVKGKAKVYTLLTNGKALLLTFYQDFKVLGDLEILKNETVTTNVQVIEDAYCIAIPVKAVREHLMHDPVFLTFLCNSLSEKLQRCTKNSSINLLYPLEIRLSSYILAMGIKKEDDELYCVLNENLTEIAELLGSSYRHLLRTINLLIEKGAIRKIYKDDSGSGSSEFQIADPKKLKLLATDLYR